MTQQGVLGRIGRQDGGSPIKARHDDEPRNTSGAVAEVIGLRATRPLSPSHVKELQVSGIDPEFASKILGWFSCNDQAQLKHLSHRSVRTRWGYGDSLVIPFDGVGSALPVAFRFKPTTPEKLKDGSAGPKYVQSRYDGVVIYVPRSVLDSDFKDVQKTLVVVEGEKKAALLAQLGYVVIGLTGVFNFEAGVDARPLDDTRHLHPEIKRRATIVGRKIVICFDADAMSNDNVMLAARRLAGVLLHGEGAESVHLAVPPRPGTTDGVDDYFVSEGGGESGAAAVKALLEGAPHVQAPVDPSDPLQKVGEVKGLRGCPKSIQQLRVPAGYSFGRHGQLFEEVESGAKGVAESAVFVARRLIDYDTHERMADVVYQGEDRTWLTHRVARLDLSDKSRMVAALAPFDGPVTSDTVGGIMRWLGRAAAANPNTPTGTAVNRVGWHTIKDEACFVLNQAYGAAGPIASVAVPEGGRGSVFGALTTSGTLDGHITALKEAWEADATVAVMICAAFAVPLLEQLDMRSFAVHVPGESSKGKTSALMFAASVWGDPSPESARMIQSWNATGNAIAARAAMMDGLPLCCDEVGATDPRELQRSVYTVINGLERGRLDKNSKSRSLKSWHTILLSTGEHHLVGDDANTGAQVRVLQMELVGGLTAESVARIREGVTANHGQAGRKWVQRLLGTDWGAARARMNEYAGLFAQAATENFPGDDFAGRQSASFALLAMTEEWLREEFGIGDEIGRTMAQAFIHLPRAEVVGVAERARRDVMDWVASEPGSFLDIVPGTSGEDQAHGEGRARIVHGYRDGDRLLFIPRSLRERLRGAGISFEQAVKGWAAQGWTDVHGKNLSSTVRLAGKKTRVVVMKGKGECNE